MFNKLSPTKKKIVYFCIGFSCIFIIPIFFWIVFFIGYYFGVMDSKIEIEKVDLETSQQNDLGMYEV